jgi:hypothetical protein
MKRFVLVVFVLGMLMSVACTSGEAEEAVSEVVATAVPPTNTPSPTATPLPTATAVPPTETPMPTATTEPTPELFVFADGAENLEQLFVEMRQAVLDEDVEKAAFLAQSIFPDEACIRGAVYEDVGKEVVTAMMEFYNSLVPETANSQQWALAFATDPDRSQVNVHATTTEGLIAYETGSVAFNEFPGGAQELAMTILKPGLTFYEVEYVAPGEDAGLKFHLFYWTGEDWCMFGPAWRVLDS